MTRDLLEITEFNLVLSPFGSIGIDLDSLKSYFKIFKNLVLLGAKLGTWCILVMSLLSVNTVKLLFRMFQIEGCTKELLMKVTKGRKRH